MKLLTLYFIVFNLLVINSKELTRDPDKYKVLTEVGKKTFYQLNNGIDIDFNNLNNAKKENENAYLYIVVNEYDEEIPTEEGRFIFQINKGEPDMSNLSEVLPDSVSNIKLEIFGGVYDVKEQTKAVENMISAGYGTYSGTVVIYNKGNEKAYQKRYKCFVKDDNGKSYGSFEIIQEDKNDKDKIEKESKNWWEKAKPYLKDGANIVLKLCEISLTVLGVARDVKSFKSSSFLNIPLLSLLIIFGLF